SCASPASSSSTRASSPTPTRCSARTACDRRRRPVTRGPGDRPDGRPTHGRIEVVTRDNNKRAVDHAADLLFYAPIGLFFEAPALMAKLAEQGRTHARNARLFGKFAVEQGEARVRERMSTVEEQATGVLRLLGVLPTPPSEPPPAPGPTPVPEPVVESATAAPAAT